jgi:FkbM family methyltransferase
MEDFQLIGEIFFINEYNFLSNRRKMIVDVGMNVGLTSLFFSKMPNVEEVHSFEPFQLPFQRALKNFSLNPTYAEKISARNFGLSDRDEQLTVFTSGNQTIGTSIRGAQSGAQETIQIRDASVVIGALAETAASRNLDFIVKIDCEGSEFAIFETLARAGLFGKIDAFVIEWHKWWSADKTQHDLIEPLLRENYIVIDRTNPIDPHAGLFYAIRTA